MATKITVNGIEYDSVDAMPPEARRLYDQMVARLPELNDRDGDGIPDIVQDLPMRRGTTVRKKFIVNGVEYDDEAAMPPDVREGFEQARRTAAAAGPTVRKNEIHVSFQMTGPHFKFRVGSGTPQATASIASMLTRPDAASEPTLLGRPRPIEPSSGGGAFRIALVLGACAAAGVALWFWMRAH